MDYLEYFLPLMVVLPILKNQFWGRNTTFNFFQLLGPIMFLTLTVISILKGMAIELTIWEFSTYFTMGFKLDALSGLIGSTVSIIGVVVSRFTVRYLEDDPKRLIFSKNLSFTLSSVLLMLLAPNMLILFFSWIGTSYFLHQLLTHFSERVGAIRAAQQKFFVSRLGDVFVFSSITLFFIAFKTVEFEGMFKLVQENDFLAQNKITISLASFLLVLGAMTKSAQFPFHFWLPNTMETPTPVSAIMHAGIINAGGYLIIRMSPVLTNIPMALSALALVGGGTAFWATLVMFTQNNIKRNLAYSTIAQMGFMMLQCGLGAFSIATVHIIGHAFYKAFAFLSSGTAVDLGRVNRYFPKSSITQNLWTPFLLSIFSVALVLGILNVLDFKILEEPGASILFLILALAVAQIILSAKDKMRGVMAAFSLVGLYIGLKFMMTSILTGIIPTKIDFSDTLSLVTLVTCSVFFIALFFIQNNLTKLSQTKIGKIIYVRALRGGF